MKNLENLIERCHYRHQNSLRQRKTKATPALYKGISYHFTVQCAYKYPIKLYELEQAGISFMPIGRAPYHDRGPKHFTGERFLKRQSTSDWRGSIWHKSWGIQIYTGKPSERNGALWHDVEITYDTICTAPDAVYTCIKALTNAVANPLLTLSKSGGIRFSCRVPNYLHPNTKDAKQYIYKHTPNSENPYHRDVYLEIIAEEGYSKWDARYEILIGNLLDPPIISKEVLFAAIDPLRDLLHVPTPLGEDTTEDSALTNLIATTYNRSLNLNLAIQAFIKKDFVYLREENNIHYWTHQNSKIAVDHVSLWEDKGIVWVEASTPDSGIPMEAAPITDVWDDTGILPTLSSKEIPVTDKVLAIREGNLSPLALKRPSPVLHKPDSVNKTYNTLEETSRQMNRVFKQNARIIGLFAETGAGKSYAAGSYILNDGTVSLTSNLATMKEIERDFEKRGVKMVVRKPRSYLWEQVKNISVAERMETPFQRGNVCEDLERCSALEIKGGNPDESICPKCPVLTECQQKGYLSQKDALINAKAQIAHPARIFLDPERSEIAEELLDQVDGTDRLCIIDEAKVQQLYIKCNISKHSLEVWGKRWKGNALGSFADALINALQTGDVPNGNAIRCVRAIIQAFEPQEDDLIQQMCLVNISGKVVPRELIDDETGNPLAHFSIEFEGGTSAYIPLDENTTTRLIKQKIQVFPLQDFVPNKDMKISMSITQTIELGILDISTIKKIKELPRVYRNPDWTFWHQIKRFFTYYKQNADAPMIWDNDMLEFWVPPVLHPKVKRLLIMSSTLNERDLHRIFPDEEIKTQQIKPTTWVPGNRVYQIRSGIYPRQTILNYDTDWDVLGMSEIGQRFFLGIQAEIKSNPNVKHAIISGAPTSRHLENIASIENVCVVKNYKQLDDIDSILETADVIWLVGVPYLSPGVTLRNAQIMYGNSETSLSYEGESEFGNYKDERVQSVYKRNVSGLLKHIIGQVGLNRLPNKTVVLLTGTPLSNITDRPETLLFDWEDFEIAGGLDKLDETIATRQHYETERDNLTAESGRDKVQQVLGCSKVHANRILNKLRGGRIIRIPFREQILSLLADGDKKTAELVAAIEGHPTSVRNELKRLIELGDIVKVRRGVYTLPNA